MHNFVDIDKIAEMKPVDLFPEHWEKILMKFLLVFVASKVMAKMCSMCALTRAAAAMSALQLRRTLLVKTTLFHFTSRHS